MKQLHKAAMRTWWPMLVVVLSLCACSGAKRISHTGGIRDFHVRNSSLYSGPGRITISVNTRKGSTVPHQLVYVEQQGSSPSDNLLHYSDVQYDGTGNAYVVTNAAGNATISFSPPPDAGGAWVTGQKRLIFSLEPGGTGGSTAVMVDLLVKAP